MPEDRSAWLVPAAGTISGACQVVSEQPLDTIKTRLQSSRYTQHAGPLQLARATVQAEGAGALLRGVAPRLLTYPFVKLSLFSLYERCFSATGSTAASGAFAGVTNTVISCPADVIKSQLQVERFAGSGGLPTTARRGAALVVNLVRNHGIAVLYRGLGPLIVRDGCGYSILYTVYFGGQEARRRYAWSQAVPGWALGGLAGTCFYAATLPIDRIKVMMQTQPGGAPASLRRCVESLRQHGVVAFYRGAGPTFVRTFVGQAVGLSVYDLITSYARAG